MMAPHQPLSMAFVFVLLASMFAEEGYWLITSQAVVL
jgi:hypothetical protein